MCPKWPLLKAESDSTHAVWPAQSVLARKCQGVILGGAYESWQSPGVGSDQGRCGLGGSDLCQALRDAEVYFTHMFPCRETHQAAASGVGYSLR